MKLGVVTFPGSNCDYDCYKAVQEGLGAQAVYLWHKEHDLRGVDAVVSDLKVQKGVIVASAVNNVGGGTTMMTLSDLSHIYVLASVDESDIGQVHLDSACMITADAYPGQRFEGKVVRIPKTAVENLAGERPGAFEHGRSLLGGGRPHRLRGGLVLLEVRPDDDERRTEADRARHRDLARGARRGARRLHAQFRTEIDPQLVSGFAGFVVQFGVCDATDPQIQQPGSIAFDGNGRMFVLELRTYMQHPLYNRQPVQLSENTTGIRELNLEPVTIVLPECLLNPPAHEDPLRCAAMVGGNVETSQRITDVLLGALAQAIRALTTSSSGNAGAAERFTNDRKTSVCRSMCRRSSRTGRW